MTDGAGRGEPDPLNETARPFRRWAGQAFGIVALITIGVIAGAKLGQPVKRVEQKVTAPIREVVKRTSPLEDLPRLIEATCPAIVALHVDGAGDALPVQGVVISGDGYILTTATIPDGTKIVTWLNDGQRLSTTVHARDPLSGINLLKADGEDLTALPLADADLPAIGRWGALISSPAGRGCMAEAATVASDFVTEGATDQYYIRVHGTGALPPPGTPFLSAEGALLAMARPGATNTPSDRYLTIDLLTKVIGMIMRSAEAPPNPLGLIAEDSPPHLAARLGGDRGRGATIILVAANSPAAKAGLRVGDVVLSAGQAPVSSASELARALGGDKAVPIVVSRSGEQATLTMTLTPPGSTPLP